MSDCLSGVFISAELLDSNFNSVRTTLLRNLLTEFGFEFKSVDGCYMGTEEKSFLVKAYADEPESINILTKLAKGFGQESILIVEDDFAYLKYMSDGQNLELGELTNVNPKRIEELKNYSIIDNKVYTIM